VVSILLSSLVFLFPLGAYCVFIARINQRRHPLLVSGVQDCAGLLLAVSGFLLFVCPSILTGFNYRPVDVWLYNHYGTLPGLGHRAWVAWIMFLWALYLVAVFCGSGFLLWTRRLRTSIYNVEPEVFDQVLAFVLTRLELAWTRSDQRVFVDVSSLAMARLGHETFPIPRTSPVTAGSLVSTRPPPDGPNRPRPALESGRSPVHLGSMETLLAVDPWPAMRHVTLHWTQQADPWREMVERELAAVLAEVRTRHNPVGTWLMTLAAGLFVLSFLVTVLLQVTRYNEGAF
jgi:hypothetical protein